MNLFIVVLFHFILTKELRSGLRGKREKRREERRNKERGEGREKENVP
jgi:hypothetical protein